MNYEFEFTVKVKVSNANDLRAAHDLAREALAFTLGGGFVSGSRGTARVTAISRGTRKLKP